MVKNIIFYTYKIVILWIEVFIKRKIIESKRDVLVYVDQSISCSYCKKLSHSFKRLSQHLKETNITFGKIDYYYNDIPEFQFKLPFPKLLLFPHDPK